MATGGGSIIEDSDYFYAFFCTVCDKKGKNVEAVKRCVDCPEDMCGECLTIHNMIGAMQGHALIDKTEVGKQDGVSRKDLPRSHDEVGCGDCFNLEHDVVPEMEKSGGEAIHVTVDDTVDTVLALVNGLEKFATVGRTDKQAIAPKQKHTVRKEDVGRADKLSLSVEQKPNIRMNDDKYVCNITDCCLFDNGNMLLTDEQNKCVKLFDKSYRAVDRCTVQSIPIAVCSIGAGEVAIALFDSKNIQIASVEQKICLTRSFSVGEVCKRASYCNTKLYITCGYNKVKVYDTRGSLLQTLGDGILGNTWHNVATRDGGCIVTNGSHGIVAFDNSGKVTWRSQHANLSLAMGICEVGDWVLVCCLRNCHVFQVNRADQSCNILLHGSDELKKTRSLTYDQANDKLIVAKENCDHMLVYKFNRN